MTEPARMTIDEIDNLIPDGESRKKTARQLGRSIKKEMHFITAGYTALPQTGRTPAQQWLWDNHYSLEREARLCLVELSAMQKRRFPQGVERIYEMLYRVLSKLSPSLDDESIVMVLSRIDLRCPLTVGQLSLLPTLLRLALISIAYGAVYEGLEREDAEREISYAVKGLTALYQIDFAAIEDTVSQIERILCLDPSGIYPKMTEESRSYYRGRVAAIAMRRGCEEREIALEAVERAKKGTDERTRHVGYYILKDPVSTSQKRAKGRMLIIGAPVAAMGISACIGLYLENFWVFLLLILPFWECTRILLERLIYPSVPADFIPRMDFDKTGERPHVVVAVATLLPQAAEAEKLGKRLVSLHFKNRYHNACYCILADFSQSGEPLTPEDQARAEAAARVVRSLNSRYDNRFALLVRRRSYSHTEDAFTGWERKRGAITELFRFLKGENTDYYTFEGDRRRLRRAQYCVTLDADTQMTFRSLERMVAAAVHPLNRPLIDEKRGIVTDGYGILVPRIGVDLKSAEATSFSRVMEGSGGITPYDTRTKDLYQDLFGEGIFSGKGLLDIDSYYKLLNNSLPQGQILSHDILEGAYLRVGFMSDIEMTDQTPPNADSWLLRFHRWVRGDWQNVLFLKRRFRLDAEEYKNPISMLSKYKLWDNLRRSMTPPAMLLCLVYAMIAKHSANALVFAVTLALLLPPLISAVSSAVSGGFFVLSRRYFAGFLPFAADMLGRAYFSAALLVEQSGIAVDAMIRALYRTFVSRKNTLAWTTAAQQQAKNYKTHGFILRFLPAQLIGMTIFLLAENPFLLIYGGIFSTIHLTIYLSGRPHGHRQLELSEEDRGEILGYAAAIWRFFENYVDEKNNFLPPDNIQFAPAYAVAARTSPTNIGMYLLSVLAAKDFGFIDLEGMHMRIDRTLSTIERMERYHGNLYNWYSTIDLSLLRPAFISAVDSGNFVCSLVALKEGVLEWGGKGAEGLVSRIETLISDTDLSIFYSKRRKLLSIGIDPDTDLTNHSYYDFLMSESRMTSYYAIACGQVERKHWGALNRSMTRNGSYAGPVSWTGTMFEYFMPYLLLPDYGGSLMGEGLRYCLYCQKKQKRPSFSPWGISESGFYAFDQHLNYQYKAHGVQQIGVKRGLDRELVLSPYSSFLTLPFSPGMSIKNLRQFKELGAYGSYGFFEAMDCTPSRTASSPYSIVRSYMSHHLGMSLVACDNALSDQIMQRRFMNDDSMASAEEFLQERIAKETVVYGRARVAGLSERPSSLRGGDESLIDIDSAMPRAMLLSNGELTEILTDTGAGFLRSGSCDLTRHSPDILRRAQGIFAFIKVGGRLIPVTKSPLEFTNVSYEVKGDSTGVTFAAESGHIEASMRCMVYPTVPTAQRQLIIKNKSAKKQTVEVLFYLEPTLSPAGDYNAHPAFSKLFVSSSYDAESRSVTFARCKRGACEEIYFTAALLEKADFDFELKKENLFSSPDGFAWVKNFDHIPFTGLMGTPDGVLAIRAKLVINPNSQGQLTLLMHESKSIQDGIAGIISARRRGGMPKEKGAPGPIAMDSAEGRICLDLLAQLLFGREGGVEREEAALKNVQGQCALWPLSISGDLPIAVLALEEESDLEELMFYQSIQSKLRVCGIEFDICLLYASLRSEELLGKALQVIAEGGREGILGARGGIFFVDTDSCREDTVTLIRASARNIPMARSGERRLTAFHPTMQRPVERKEFLLEGLPVYGGCFVNDRFYVDRISPLPYCHLLSNPGFGSLMSDKALGFTWATNSRENKLTPWYNDIATDNNGELLLLRVGESCYNLIEGSLASFSSKDALYEGMAGRISTHVEVSVATAGGVKYMDVTLTNQDEREVEAICAYYIEPVLGVDRSRAMFIKPHLDKEGLLLSNPYGSGVMGYALMASNSEISYATTNRAAFLSGDWLKKEVKPQSDPCAAIIIKRQLPPKRSVHIRFILGFATEEKAVKRLAAMPKSTGWHPENSYRITTPDKYLDSFINGFLPNQIVGARMWGRCGFYQCGGAFGFRDQLQDACGALFFSPELAKRQIYRACAVQFTEGDVLHWWHRLPASGGGTKGVRTRYSDDLLWLPYTVCEYLERTEDSSILSPKIAYITAPILEDGEHERYITPQKSDLKEDVYHHCLRAIERAARLGDKGLPLMGCGDWNDSFNQVGAAGRGQSVWLALFLAHLLCRFAPICRQMCDDERADRYEALSHSLKEAVDRECWEGRWYLRAFYDDGEPMGSVNAEECRIDLLPQSFASIAGMSNSERVNSALDCAMSELVDEEKRIVRLFAPPFSRSRQNPGYVKFYPSGIRENGGQYTHSAIWLAIGLFEAGRVDEGYHVLQMLNPADRCKNKELADAYKLEPYYLAADISTNQDALGHGGWSIYTGAAAWYYRGVMQWLLGITLRGDHLLLTPKLPIDWPGFDLEAVIMGTRLSITVKRTGTSALFCDGKPTDQIELDGQPHSVELTL